MKTIDIQTGKKYTVLSYTRTSEEEIIYAAGWPGAHIIGVDCEFERDAKCECTSDETTGYVTEKICNICGEIVK